MVFSPFLFFVCSIMVFDPPWPGSPPPFSTCYGLRFGVWVRVVYEGLFLFLRRRIVCVRLYELLWTPSVVFLFPLDFRSTLPHSYSNASFCYNLPLLKVSVVIPPFLFAGSTNLLLPYPFSPDYFMLNLLTITSDGGTSSRCCS